jgi:hypothetical protein
MISSPEVPKSALKCMNQLYFLKTKAKKNNFYHLVEREVENMESNFAEHGFVIHDPIGEKCPETRTDVEVNIAGSNTEDLVIVEVIKPIIRHSASDNELSRSTVIQKGTVVAENQPS